jgi:hypothetical protein
MYIFVTGNSVVGESAFFLAPSTFHKPNPLISGGWGGGGEVDLSLILGSDLTSDAFAHLRLGGLGGGRLNHPVVVRLALCVNHVTSLNPSHMLPSYICMWVRTLVGWRRSYIEER